MNHLKRICFLNLFLFAFVSLARAQELTIGDTLPDIVLRNVLRYPSDVVRLSDFRGKVLILDLWRTTCGHAVASFGHFDSLQNEFPGKLAVFAITTERQDTIKQYLQQNDYAARTKLAVITDDTVLAGKRFPFIYIPHVVVANEKGIIVGISRFEAITKAVVQSITEGRPPALALKKEVTDFDYYAPLLSQIDDSTSDKVAYSSTFGHRLPGVMSIQDIYTSGGNWIYTNYNASIPELYAKAYHVFLQPNRILLDVKNPGRFTSSQPDDEQWKDRNLWCYNLLLPKETIRPEQMVIKELNRFFGITASFEKRKSPCLLLVKKGNGEGWKPKQPNAGDYFLDSGNVVLIRNTMLSAVISSFDYVSRIPIIDKTGIQEQPVDMRIEGSPNNLAQFRKQLWKYNLDLIPSTTVISILVITEESDEKRIAKGNTKRE